MSHEIYALLTVTMTLLGVVIVSTWRFSALATKLTDTIHHLEQKSADLEARTKVLEEVPAITLRLSHVEKNHSLIPAVMSRVSVLEEKAKHSKEMRQAFMRRSQPDTEDE